MISDSTKARAKVSALGRINLFTFPKRVIKL